MPPDLSALAGNDHQDRVLAQALSTQIEITSRRGDPVLLARADYEALEETVHLLRVPANAWRLTEGLQRILIFWIAGHRSDARPQRDPRMDAESVGTP